MEIKMTETIASLVKKLRMSPSPEAGREIALQLATSPEEEHHEELYRMANGEVMRYTPRTWKTLWLRLPVDRYGLEDQLSALDALAETGTERAFNFLKILYVENVDHPSERWGAEWTYVAHGTTHSGCEEVYHTYPNARGALKTALNYSYDVFNPDDSSINSSVHNRVKGAIQRIEEAYKQ